MRLNSLHILWNAIKEEDGEEQANKCITKIIDGSIFVNDLHNILTGYCYAFDLSMLVTSGIEFYDNGIPITKPKRSDSFIDLVIQSTSYISNQITGAVSYPNFFMFLDWYYRNELGKTYMNRIKNNPTKYTKKRKNILNQFKNLIYSLNWPFRGIESSFTNLSVLDKGFVKNLLGDYVFPDGSKLGEYEINSMIELSKMFFG
jgi:ribonucleoside-triphosphate reductase